MADARLDELTTLLPQCLLPDWVRLGTAPRPGAARSPPPAPMTPCSIDYATGAHSVALREQRQRNVPQVSYPPDLPITARKDEIVAAIRAHQVVVIAGETGSRKTTQIPKMCPMPAWASRRRLVVRNPAASRRCRFRAASPRS